MYYNKPRHFLMAIIICLATACDSTSSADYHKEAAKLDRVGKYKEAIPLLNKAIEKDARNIRALLDRAVDYSELKDYKNAIGDYSAVIKIDSNNALAFLNRGKNRKRLNDFVGAITDFNHAIATKGGEMIYTNKVENNFIDNGFEYDVSMEEIKFERGIAFYNIDSLKRAFDDFNFCISKKFLLSDSYYWRGLILLNTTNLKKVACKDLNKSKELGNTDAEALIVKYCK
jgi:tetratricopeptide (TPR) repeat protein